MKRIYLDHAATTPLDSRVKAAMEPWWDMEYGNAGGLYEEGRRAKEAMQSSRETIAKLIGAKTDEIIFTSGGTEADNLAVFGVARATAPPSQNASAGKHIITTTFEHHAVLNPCQELAKQGFDITYLDVGKDGIVNPEDIRKALRLETILVSIIYATER